MVMGGYSWLCYSYTTSYTVVYQEYRRHAVIELEAEVKPRLLIQ